MGVRQRRVQRLSAVGAAAALTLSVLSAQGGLVQAATTAPACGQPEVREAMVSQGLPSYDALARGKQTLVKLFLSRRQGCTATVTVRSATAVLSSSAGEHGRVPLANAATLVELPAYETAPLTNSNSDPYFVVPGTLLQPPGPLPSPLPYDLRVRVELVYDAVVNRVSYPGQTMSVSDVRGTPIGAAVDAAGQPLRVLVVPMGDADEGYAGVFPSASQTALRSAMQSLHRVLPLADGIGTVESETGGLRYTVAPSQQLVDLGPHEETTVTGTKVVSYLGADGLYCGGGGSFTYVQTELAEARTAWNSTHPEAQHVDRVLGVIAPENSRGATTGTGAACADGYAGINAPEAWFRLVSRSTDGRFVAGYLGALETGHTLGAVAAAASNGYHSLSTEADGTAPGRAYHVPRREHLAEDQPTMRYAPTGLHDDNTLLEPADWSLAQCVLVAGAAGRACPGSETAVGAVSAGGGALHLSGSTDGTREGTSVHTYVVPGRSEPRPADGPYYVQLFGPAGVPLDEVPVPVSTAQSHHDDHEGHQHEESGVGVFDIAVDAGGAESFRLVHRDPATGEETELHARRIDGEPTVDQVVTSTGGRVPYESGPGRDADPDVSPDGRWTAWSAPDGVRLRSTDDSSGPSALVPGASEPDWSPDGERLAVARDGAIDVVEVSLPSGDGPPEVGDSRTVYAPPVRQLPAGRAASPAWSWDGTRLAAVLDGSRLAVLDVEAPSSDCLTARGCEVLLVGLSVGDPSWSSPREDAPDGLVAYETRRKVAGVLPGAAGEPVIATVDPRDPAAQVERLAGEDPAWSADRLLLADGDGIASVDGASFADPRRETTVAGDSQPSPSADGAVVAFTATDPETAQDVYLQTEVQQTRQVVATDDRPQDLRLDVFLDCAESLVPVATALRGDRAGDRVVFDVDLDETAACPGGRAVYRVTDGWQVDTERDPEVLAGREQDVVAVTSPRPGEVVDEHAPLPLDLDGWSSGGERLPVTWSIRGTALSGTSDSAETPDVTARLAPGAYELVAEAGGSSTVVPFVVRADTDHDGLPDTVDVRTELLFCYPEDARTSATNAVTDYDGDLLVGRADADPCRSAFDAKVAFEPQTVLLGSSGTPLTLTITTPHDATVLRPSDVRLTSMAGFPVDQAASALVEVAGRTFQAKFDRPAYSATALERGLRKGYVPVVVSVTAPTGTSRGTDPRYPVHTS